MKFAIVGDLHLGATNKKSPIGNAFVKGQHAYIDQMISEWKEAEVTHVVFLGDIFDNERFIATDVMDYALRLFRDKLADFKVFVIAGNHDMRYTNTSEVCSVSFLGLIPHVTVYDAKIGVEHFFGREWIFVPWILQDNMDKVNKWLVKLSRSGVEKRVILGHFDIIGAAMGAGNISQNGFDSKRLLNAATLTFSGHYHVGSEMNSDESAIIYTGTPYHMTFSHVGSTPGYYIVDDEGCAEDGPLNLEFRENKLSPRFIDVKDVDIDAQPADLSNCVVRLFSDKACSMEQYAEVKTKLVERNPIYIDQYYYGDDGTIVSEDGEVIDEEEAKRILSSDSLGMASMYMDKHPDILPVLNDQNVDAKSKIIEMLREYDAK